MSRYIPTASEQAAIDKLRLANYVVVRARTYDALLERVRVAGVKVEMALEARKSSEGWAGRCIAEERRLSRRLDEVCTAAAALGVPISAINQALAKANP